MLACALACLRPASQTAFLSVTLYPCACLHTCLPVCQSDNLKLINHARKEKGSAVVEWGGGGSQIFDRILLAHGFSSRKRTEITLLLFLAPNLNGLGL